MSIERLFSVLLKSDNKLYKSLVAFVFRRGFIVRLYKFIV